MTLSPGPPPWPIPPSWTSPPSPDEAGPAVVVLVPEGVEPPGVAVEVRAVAVPEDGFGGVYALAGAVAAAGGPVVVAWPGSATAETAWALDLLHAGEAPLILAGSAADVTDAIAVAAAVPAGSGCLLVTRGEVHAARHAGSAGPMGYVTDGVVRLLWRAPERLTVRGPHGKRSPRVGVYTAGLGDDGELLRTLAERCDGLVVAAPSAMPEAALTEAATRVPIVLSTPAPHAGPLTTTDLDPLRARVLMHLLLAAGRDHDAVLTAFATEGPAEL